MLAKRIIPCLDIKNGRVVKGVNFINLLDAGDPVELARVYDKQNADELVFLDITASSDRRKTVVELAEAVANQVFIPFTVGGGIRTVENIRDVLLAGAEKVSLNTAALENPKVLSDGADLFGSQCIVLAMDAKRIKKASGEEYSAIPDDVRKHCRLDEASQFEVYVHGGRTPTGVDAIKWAKYGKKCGAGEILLTSMDADGTKNGYDLVLTKAIKEAVNIPVIASGGAGSLEHIKDALEIADAALLASLLHYGELSIKQIKDYLDKNGVSVRK